MNFKKLKNQVVINYRRDRELRHTLRYHLDATKWGRSDGKKRERDGAGKRASSRNQSLFRGLMLIEILSNYPNGFRWRIFRSWLV